MQSENIFRLYWVFFFRRIMLLNEFLEFLLWFLVGGLTSGTDVGTEVSHTSAAISHHSRSLRYQLAGTPFTLDLRIYLNSLIVFFNVLNELKLDFRQKKKRNVISLTKEQMLKQHFVADLDWFFNFVSFLGNRICYTCLFCYCGFLFVSDFFSNRL